MVRAAAEDNGSEPGAVCSQVSWWVTGGGGGGGGGSPESTGPVVYVVSRSLPCFAMHGCFACSNI